MPKPTAKQLGERFAMRPQSKAQNAKHAKIREAIRQAAIACVGLTPGSAEQSRAINKLDEAAILFHLAVSRNE